MTIHQKASHLHPVGADSNGTDTELTRALDRRQTAMILLGLRRLSDDLTRHPQDVDTSLYFEEEGLDPPGAGELRALAQLVNTETVTL
jgi:hypothetical protein